MTAFIIMTRLLIVVFSFLAVTQCTVFDNASGVRYLKNYLFFINNLIVNSINQTVGSITPLLPKVDPDVGRTTEELITSRGFTSETHYVTTEDNYILGLHRIITPKTGYTELKKPVLLQHGIQVSSQCWLNTALEGGIGNPPINESDPGANLGFELAKKGYDVWLANSRGTTYSRNHTRLNPKSLEFWDFSHDEMIKYDMPAVIDYILRVTGRPRLGYIGHSQGVSIMLGLLSSQPRYNDLIRPFIALAPVFLVGNGTRTNLIRTATSNEAFNHFLFDRGGSLLGILGGDAVFRYLIQKFCRGVIISEMCFALFQPILGSEDFADVDSSRISVYFGSDSLGESMKNIQHWIQNFHSQARDRKHFMFDYGPQGNMKRYGQISPPFYDLSRITNRHIYISYGKNDGLVGPRDVRDLKKSLYNARVIVTYQVPRERFSHVDFLWARSADEHVVRNIFRVLKKHGDM